LTAPLTQRVAFDRVRYASCWEDADVLCAALAARRGARVLSIASAGDNSLALLAEGATVIAADLSSAQIACVDLRAAAFRVLDHPALLAFLGARPSRDRLAVYGRLRDVLPARARVFWDAHPAEVEAGAIHAGKFEAYFRLFRTRVLPLVHGSRTIARLLEPKDERARQAFYDEVWNTWRWRLLFRVFFGRFVMGRLGRDPEFFRYVEGSVADRILERTRHALTVLATDKNPYLQYILTGSFGTLPRYLEPAHFEAVREGLERLTLVEGAIEEAARVHRDQGFDGFNLSDLFEYLDPATCERVYGTLLESARPGARLAYWNMMVPRRCPEPLRARVRPLDAVAAPLFRADRAFFYRAFVVEEVV
jgi:S-adenosylmethionine-diacylglycerol 3-amino-3-carboxypropyl transferase